MNGYFYVLTAIDLFVLSFMCILTKLSESLNKKQKQGFFLAFALIAAISVLEVVTLAVDGTPAGYRWLNILSNYLGFGLSPGVCLCLVYVMDRKKRMNRWFRAAVCCEAPNQKNYPYRTPTGKRLTILERVHIFSYLISFRKVIKELYSNRTKRFLPMDTFHNLRPARVSCRGVH